MTDGPIITLSASFDRDGNPAVVAANGPARDTEAQAREDLDFFPKSARMLVQTGINSQGRLYYQVRMVANVVRGGCVSKAAMARYRTVIRNAPSVVWSMAFVNGYATRDDFEFAMAVRS